MADAPVRPGPPALIVLAHGTNDAAGRRTWGRLLVRLRSLLPGVTVQLAYAGVAKPRLADVLDRSTDTDVGCQRSTAADTERPYPYSDHGGHGAVVVPCFLAAGFHVRVDVPDQLAELRRAGGGDGGVVLADPLGPDPALVDVALARLAEAGASPGDDTVVLAAAGSTDPRAQEDLRVAAAVLRDRLGHEVPVGYIAGGEPRVADVVAAQPGRVALATWLLAPGAFHRWLADAGAAVVAEPLGDHPGVAAVVVERYRAALPPAS